MPDSTHTTPKNRPNRKVNISVKLIARWPALEIRSTTHPIKNRIPDFSKDVSMSLSFIHIRTYRWWRYITWRVYRRPSCILVSMWWKINRDAYGYNTQHRSAERLNIHNCLLPEFQIFKVILSRKIMREVPSIGTSPCYYIFWNIRIKMYWIIANRNADLAVSL